MIDLLENGKDIVAPSDQVFVPTFVDDIAVAIDTLLKIEAHGVYHVVGNDALSPYKIALEIADLYGFDPSLIKKTTFLEYFSNKAPIPQYAALSNNKLQTLGILMKTFHAGLKIMKKQDQECTL